MFHARGKISHATMCSKWPSSIFNVGVLLQIAMKLVGCWCCCSCSGYFATCILLFLLFLFDETTTNSVQCLIFWLLLLPVAADRWIFRSFMLSTNQIRRQTFDPWIYLLKLKITVILRFLLVFNWVVKPGIRRGGTMASDLEIGSAVRQSVRALILPKGYHTHIFSKRGCVRKNLKHKLKKIFRTPTKLCKIFSYPYKLKAKIFIPPHFLLCPSTHH